VKRREAERSRLNGTPDVNVKDWWRCAKRVPQKSVISRQIDRRRPSQSKSPLNRQQSGGRSTISLLLPGREGGWCSDCWRGRFCKLEWTTRLEKNGKLLASVVRVLYAGRLSLAGAHRSQLKRESRPARLPFRSLPPPASA